MIARLWHGRATREKAPAYRQHATQHVFPRLAALPGHQGAYLLARETDGQVEFLAVTLWDSIDAIKRFSGPNPEAAVIEPEARAILTDFDTVVQYYEVAHTPAGLP